MIFELRPSIFLTVSIAAYPVCIIACDIEDQEHTVFGPRVWGGGAPVVDVCVCACVQLHQTNFSIGHNF